LSASTSAAGLALPGELGKLDEDSARVRAGAYFKGVPWLTEG